LSRDMTTSVTSWHCCNSCSSWSASLY